MTVRDSGSNGYCDAVAGDLVFSAPVPGQSRGTDEFIEIIDLPAGVQNVRTVPEWTVGIATLRSLALVFLSLFLASPGGAGAMVRAPS